MVSQRNAGWRSRARNVIGLAVAVAATAGIATDGAAQSYRRYRQPTPSNTAVIEYMAHLQGTGDTPWIMQPGICGTTGENRRLEGFAIQHAEASQDEIVLRYRVHVQDLGDQDWTYIPELAGTRGEKRRLEAIWIEVVDKPDEYSVHYRAHLHGRGWTPWVKDGAMCGTRNQQRAVEAIQIMVVDRVKR